MALLPIGVASRSCGNDGLAFCAGCDGSPGRDGAPVTGLAFGDGGMARPNLGVRAPPFDRLPGMGGRSNGAGEDIIGTGGGLVGV